MKSGLEGRNNNAGNGVLVKLGTVVSMKSGLEGRNNDPEHPNLFISQTMSQ